LICFNLRLPLFHAERNSEHLLVNLETSFYCPAQASFSLSKGLLLRVSSLLIVVPLAQVVRRLWLLMHRSDISVILAIVPFSVEVRMTAATHERAVPTTMGLI